MSQGFNHFDENGNAVMVDVSGKNVTYRTAVATGEIHVGEAIMEAVKEGSVKKGDVLGVARVAGIMGVKRTSELIPMCHPLPIQKCSEVLRHPDRIQDDLQHSVNQNCNCLPKRETERKQRNILRFR